VQGFNQQRLDIVYQVCRLMIIHNAYISFVFDRHAAIWRCG
jgi:hypothetical protein